MGVTLLEVIAAAKGRQASLVGEMAGYLVLGVADQVALAPRQIDPGSVELAPGGSVAVGSAAACSIERCEQSLRGLLARLLRQARSPSTALLRAAERTPRCDLAALVRELESALIPVNRAAGRRSLARLQRETQRAVTAGALLNDEPSDAPSVPVAFAAPIPARSLPEPSPRAEVSPLPAVKMELHEPPALLERQSFTMPILLEPEVIEEPTDPMPEIGGRWLEEDGPAPVRAVDIRSDATPVIAMASQPHHPKAPNMPLFQECTQPLPEVGARSTPTGAEPPTTPILASPVTIPEADEEAQAGGYEWTRSSVIQASPSELPGPLEPHCLTLPLPTCMPGVPVPGVEEEEVIELSDDEVIVVQEVRAAPPPPPLKADEGAALPRRAALLVRSPTPSAQVVLPATSTEEVVPQPEPLTPSCSLDAMLQAELAEVAEVQAALRGTLDQDGWDSPHWASVSPPVGVDSSPRMDADRRLTPAPRVFPPRQSNVDELLSRFTAGQSDEDVFLALDQLSQFDLSPVVPPAVPRSSAQAARWDRSSPTIRDPER